MSNDNDNDNDSDHSFSQLPEHNAPTRPKGQRLVKELRSMHKIINHGAPFRSLAV